MDDEQQVDNRLNYMQAETYKKNNSRVKQMPRYSMPKTIYHSYFGLKPNEKPTPGPGAHNNQHIRSISSNDSGVLISPSKMTNSRSMINESRARIEAAVGPGAY